MLRISGPDQLSSGAGSDLELVTLADLKAQLDRSGLGTGDDTLLQQMLDNAQRFLFSYLGDRFIKATGTANVYVLDGSSSYRLLLPQWPVVSVTSIIEGYVSAAPNTFTTNRTLQTSDYYTDLDTGQIISRVGGWPGGWDTYKVTWTSGYATIPDDLQEAIAQWVGVKLMRLKDRRWDKQTSSGAEGSASFTADDMPAFARSVFRRYQRPEMFIG